MDAVRQLRRCVTDNGFRGLRVVPWLWEAPPTDRRYCPLCAACVELGVPFFTQVGHTGPLRIFRASWRLDARFGYKGNPRETALSLTGDQSRP